MGPLTVAYVLIRGLVFPFFLFHYIDATYITASHAVPPWAVHVITACILGVVVGSFFWTRDLVKGYRKHRAKHTHHKQQ